MDYKGKGWQLFRLKCLARCFVSNEKNFVDLYRLKSWLSEVDLVQLLNKIGYGSCTRFFEGLFSFKAHRIDGI